MEQSVIRSPFVRKMVLYGAPLLMGIVELLHPAGYTADIFHRILPAAGLWLGLHLAQLVLFSLLGLSVFLLSDGCAGWMATASRISAVAFALAGTARTAVDGVAVGILVREAAGLPYTQQETVARAVQELFFDPLAGGGFSLLGIIGTMAWLLAALFAAECRHRVGASFAGVAVVIVSATLFGITPGPPYTAAALACFTLGVLLMERPLPGIRTSPVPEACGPERTSPDAGPAQGRAETSS